MTKCNDCNVSSAILAPKTVFDDNSFFRELGKRNGTSPDDTGIVVLDVAIVTFCHLRAAFLREAAVRQPWLRGDMLFADDPLVNWF